MRVRHLYQCVEDRGDTLCKPIICKADDAWLGEGFYFWDSEIDDAHWWGHAHYGDLYLIYQSQYDYDSLDYLDLLGNTEHRKYFFTFAEAIKNKRNGAYTVGQTIELLKRIDKQFLTTYKAIRALPENLKSKTFHIYFENDKFFLSNRTRIQMCVIDTSFLIEGKFVQVFRSSDNIAVV